MADRESRHLGQTNGSSVEPRLDAILRCARVYLDTGLPEKAHDLLLSRYRQTPEGCDSPARSECMVLLAQSCRVLGHRGHLDELLPELERLFSAGTSCSPETRTRGIAVLALIHAQRGDYSIALQLCGRIDPEILDHSSAHASLSLASAQVHVLSKSGNFDDAAVVAAEALGRMEKEGDSALQGSACALMANILKMRGLLPEALRLYHKAAVLHRQGGDLLGLGNDQLNRATLLNRLGLLQDGKKALRDATQTGYGNNVALTLRLSIAMAMLGLRMDDLPASRSALLRTWRHARRLNLRREEALSLEFLAEVLILLGRLPSARRALSLCRRLATRIAPEGDIVAELGIREALLRLHLGTWSEAAASALAAVELSQQRKLPWEEAQARRLLGIALFRQERPDEAAAQLARAQQLFGEMGESFEIHLVRRWIEFVASESGRRTGDLLASSRIGPPGLHPSWLVRVGIVDFSGGGTCLVPADLGSAAANVPLDQGGEDREADSRAARRFLAKGASSGLDPFWRELGLLTQSPKMRRLLVEAQDIAASGGNVLILGETGTGKELLARAIHHFSGRSGRFVPFNCGACPVDLFESEIFGAERGAYTGADHSRSGLARVADGGTLFFDEVADMEVRGQTALLRFLDSGEVRALGSTQIINVRLGVVAATLQALDDRMARGLFRQDLYYRLAQGVLALPPLRERVDDLPLLLTGLWERRVRSSSLPRCLLQDGILSVLESYSWPGNLRELDRLVCAVARRTRAQGAHVELGVADVHALLTGGRVVPGVTQREVLPTSADVRKAIEAAQGNRSMAAGLLGISRPCLYRILRGGKDSPSS